MKHARPDYNRIQDPAGVIPDDEPVQLFRGQDRYAADVCRYYADRVEADGGDPEIVRRSREQAALIDAWPTKKRPDISAAQSAAPPKLGKFDIPNWSAGFAASALFDLEPIIRSAQDQMARWSVQGLVIEPCTGGGVLLVATDGVTMAVVRDPGGYASAPMRVYVPEALFIGAKPPEAVPGIYEGDRVDLDLPEWAQPGQVWLTGISAYVFPRMPHPADRLGVSHALASAMAETGNVYRGLYRLFDPPIFNWRKVASNLEPVASPDFPIALNPWHLAKFRRLIRRYAAPGDEKYNNAVVLQPTGPRAVTIIRVECTTDFLGLIMPMDVGHGPLPPLPDWLNLHAGEAAP